MAQKGFDLEQQSPLVKEHLPSTLKQNYLHQPILYNSVQVASPIYEEDNCCLGCCMGWLFGFFGLLCLCCVNDKASYLKGWVIPFVIWIVAVIVLVVLVATGVFSVLSLKP